MQLYGFCTILVRLDSLTTNTKRDSDGGQLMKEWILDFVTKYPVVFLPLLLLVPFVLKRKYRRWQRATANANDLKSKVLVGFGLVVAIVIIGIWLSYN